MNPLYTSLPDTIFDVMSGLARETGAINLGQGFPEWDGPRDIREYAAKAVIDGFYSSGIVTDQYSDDDIPVLEVGQRFLELSDQDKRRVAMFIDDTFGITKAHGLFLIYFHKHETPVGLFTSEGLQLQ